LSTNRQRLRVVGALMLHSRASGLNAFASCK
jgi:hypothetical protein